MAEKDSETLEDFLHQMHETSSVSTIEGMPSLEWIKANFKTKSAAIRYLGHTLGFDPKTIAHHLDINYQHAYNVLHQQLKRGPNEIYAEEHWQCPHTKAPIVIDMIARKGVRDPNTSRVLYRVCSECAKDLIPGVTEESLQKIFPGVKR